MLLEQGIEKSPIPAEQVHEVMAFGADTFPVLHIPIRLIHLFLEGLDPRRQDSHQSEPFPFFFCKCRSFIQKGIIDPCITFFHLYRTFLFPDAPVILYLDNFVNYQSVILYNYKLCFKKGGCPCVFP